MFCRNGVTLIRWISSLPLVSFLLFHFYVSFGGLGIFVSFAFLFLSISSSFSESWFFPINWIVLMRWYWLHHTWCNPWSDQDDNRERNTWSSARHDAREFEGKHHFLTIFYLFSDFLSCFKSTVWQDSNHQSIWGCNFPQVNWVCVIRLFSETIIVREPMNYNNWLIALLNNVLLIATW